MTAKSAVWCGAMPENKIEKNDIDSSDGADSLGQPGRRPPPAVILLILVFVIAGYFGYQEFQERQVSLYSEDARIQADMITISSRVAGWITNVSAKEGQSVADGTPLIFIDDRDARAIVDELNARLEGIGAEKDRLKAQKKLVRKRTDSRLAAARSELSAAQVTVSSLVPQLQLSKREVERTTRLFKRKVASRRQMDEAEQKLQRVEREHEIALAMLKGARARVKQAEAERAKLGVLIGDLGVLTKREIEIRAKITRQTLDIDDRIIESPVEGVIDRRFVNAGEYVTPGQRLILIHDPKHIWIEANIKETEVRRLKNGQPVRISIDAYPDELFEGKVERIGSTATSVFALLPSPNPSGNFTKITQRLPVRIAIDQRDGRFRPGMMVEIKIVTGP